MRKATLIVATFALILQSSVMGFSELPAVDPENIFRVNLLNNDEVHLFPQGPVLRVQGNPGLSFFFADAFRALASDAVLFFLMKDNWSRSVSLDPFERFRATVLPGPYWYDCR